MISRTFGIGRGPGSIMSTIVAAGTLLVGGSCWGAGAETHVTKVAGVLYTLNLNHACQTGFDGDYFRLLFHAENNVAVNAKKLTSSPNILASSEGLGQNAGIQGAELVDYDQRQLIARLQSILEPCGDTLAELQSNSASSGEMLSLCNTSTYKTETIGTCVKGQVRVLDATALWSYSGFISRIQEKGKPDGMVGPSKATITLERSVIIRTGQSLLIYGYLPVRPGAPGDQNAAGAKAGQMVFMVISPE